MKTDIHHRIQHLALPILLQLDLQLHHHHLIIGYYSRRSSDHRPSIRPDRQRCPQALQQRHHNCILRLVDWYFGWKR
jgi:hypothetical protein